MLDELRPDWWSLALCRGDGCDAWMVGRGRSGAHVEELRAICGRCPAAVDCLIDALDEPIHDREFGPFRVGVTGPANWRLVRDLVADVAPVSRQDFEVIVSMILDEEILVDLRRLARTAA